MSTHNICFYGELEKIILELSSYTPPYQAPCKLLTVWLNARLPLFSVLNSEGSVLLKSIQLHYTDICIGPLSAHIDSCRADNGTI